MDRIDELRVKYGVPSTRNIAYAEAKIPGVDSELVSISGNASPKDTVSLPTTRQLHPIKLGFDERDNHSELKILELIMSKTDDRTVGSLKLYSQREPCPSDEAIIKEFRKLRKGIKVEVEYGHDR